VAQRRVQTQVIPTLQWHSVGWRGINVSFLLEEISVPIGTAGAPVLDHLRRAAPLIFTT
jgi:hypothetical protein